MNRVLVLATRNRKKRKELTQLLQGLPYELRTLEDYPDAPSVEETGATFEANAVLKARAIALATGELTLADDSGLEVDALDGRPGVYSARFSGEGATDEGNRALLLRLLEDVPLADRSARFECVIALCGAGDRVELAYGTCEGRIADRARGEWGFGYDPIFVPDGRRETMAELEPEIKHALSHRGAALREIHPVLERLARTG